MHKRITTILVLAFGFAILGFGLHGCPGAANALEGTAPITVSNGDVGITVPTCSSGQFITGNGSAFTCSAPSTAVPVKTVQRKTADQSFVKNDPVAAVTDFTGWTFTGGKTYLLEGNIFADPNVGGSDVSLALINASGTLTGWNFVFQVWCIAGVQKADFHYTIASAASTGYLTCDLGTTEDTLVQVRAYVYGGSSDVVMDLYAAPVVGGSGVKDYDLKAGSTMWIEEVS